MSFINEIRSQLQEKEQLDPIRAVSDQIIAATESAVKRQVQEDARLPNSARQLEGFLQYIGDSVSLQFDADNPFAYSPLIIGNDPYRRNISIAHIGKSRDERSVAFAKTGGCFMAPLGGSRQLPGMDDNYFGTFGHHKDGKKFGHGYDLCAILNLIQLDTAQQQYILDGVTKKLWDLGFVKPEVKAVPYEFFYRVHTGLSKTKDLSAMTVGLYLTLSW